MNTNRPEYGIAVKNIYSSDYTNSFGGYAKLRAEVLKNGVRVKNVPTTISIVDLDQMQQPAKDSFKKYNVRQNVNKMTITEFVRIEGFKPNKYNTYITTPDPDIGITPDGTFIGLKNDVSSGYGTKNSPKWRKKAAFIKDNIFKDGYTDITVGSSFPRSGIALYFTVGELTVKYNIDNTNAGSVTKNDELLQFNNTPTGSYKINEGYKAKYWTCDQDVTINGKIVTAGNPINLNDLNKVSVQNFYTFTLHTDKPKGSLKINKTN